MCIATVLSVDVVTLTDGRPGRRVNEHWRDPDDGEIISKPFIFDGNSSPRFLWVIVPPFKDLEGACRHDWDCKCARVVMARGGRDNYIRALKIRKKGDKLYRKKKQRTDGKFIAFLAYWGVRTGSACGAGWEKLNYEVQDETPYVA